MRAINSTDIQIGSSDISVKLYSAIEQEITLKQISPCCNAAVQYKRVCSSCSKELDFNEIKKGLAIGEEVKEIDSTALKVENGNLRILGLIDDSSEEEGVFKDGSVWFIGFDLDKKNKTKTQRNLMKFSYLREVLRNGKSNLIGLISMRGKEHIILLKPYFNALVGLGLYHFDRIRDVKEISGYSEIFNCDENTLKQMVLNFAQKETIKINSIENKRNKLIEAQMEIKEVMNSENIKPTKQELENPLELCSF